MVYKSNYTTAYTLPSYPAIYNRENSKYPQSPYRFSLYSNNYLNFLTSGLALKFRVAIRLDTSLWMIFPFTILILAV